MEKDNIQIMVADERHLHLVETILDTIQQELREKEESSEQ